MYIRLDVPSRLKYQGWCDHDVGSVSKRCAKFVAAVLVCATCVERKNRHSPLYLTFCAMESGDATIKKVVLGRLQSVSVASRCTI